ncbi:DUF202 domain-containing protein [Hydrogenophaga sp.]|jgi:uncharacterized membrane protein YidH (DUF202 family)|uniref:DUF202 domain-containing protein n=1 Tax=Hydrogenophaga sp. TaxID=1904254 RepID=UPI003F6F05A6
MSAIRDPGLQPERTQLAWSRTGLVMVLDAALMLRLGYVGASTMWMVSAVLFAALSIVVFEAGSRRGAELAMNRLCAPPQVLMLFVSASMVAAAASVVVAFFLLCRR